LYNCQSCKKCFGCTNLINKEYYVFNKPVKKEEFEDAYIKMVSSRSSLIDAKKRFTELKLVSPNKFLAGYGNENVTGDHISYCKNVFESFDVTYCEDCKFCVWWHKAKNCYDCYGWAMPGELGLENHLVGNTFYNVSFSESCANNVTNLLYCRYCENGTSDCFGCFGLRHKQYCILNKQYSKKGYEELMPKIIDHMRKTGEWGEFFPSALSPYGYNETVANEYFPLSKNEIEKKKLNFKKEDRDEAKYGGSFVEIPDTVSLVSDKFIEKNLTCEITRRPYKIVSSELQFYREMNIPLPTRCFDQRHTDRLAMRTPRKLWRRNCDNCGIPMQTAFSPDRREKIYCEKCYLKSVY
jgi:hypothetical protein